MRELLRTCLLGVLLVFSAIGTPAGALDLALVVSGKGGAYERFAQSLRASLGAGTHRLYDGGNLEEGVAEDVVRRADLVLAGGFPAAEAMLGRSSRPLMAVLISRSQYRALRRSHPDAPFAAIVLDQPPARQLALVHAVLPERNRLGVLYGPDTRDQEREFVALSGKSGMELLGQQVSTPLELTQALERTLEASDALLALADPLLSTPTAARSILLSSYRYRRPVFAWSRAFVDAGALAAVYSGPGDIARDVVDWLAALPAGRLPEPQMCMPRHFGVALNSQVARALNLRVEDAASVLRRLQVEERP